MSFLQAHACLLICISVYTYQRTVQALYDAVEYRFFVFKKVQNINGKELGLLSFVCLQWHCPIKVVYLLVLLADIAIGL